MVHIRKIIFICHRDTPTTYMALSYYIKCFLRLCSRSKCQSLYSTLETKLSLDIGADIGRVRTKGMKCCSRIQNSFCPGTSAWGPLTTPWSRLRKPARPPRLAFLTPTPLQPPGVLAISTQSPGHGCGFTWVTWRHRLALWVVRTVETVTSLVWFATAAALSVTVPTWHTAGVQNITSWKKRTESEHLLQTHCIGPPLPSISGGSLGLTYPSQKPCSPSLL